jgi:hypothetical protein
LHECGTIVFLDRLDHVRYPGDVLVIVEGVSPPRRNAEGRRAHGYDPGAAFGERLVKTDPHLLKVTIFPGVKARRRACL